MTINKSPGFLLLAIYLILLGLLSLIKIPVIGGLLPILALVAGILILIGK
jgi:hypothetical protein